MYLKDALVRGVLVPLANKMTARQFWAVYRRMMDFERQQGAVREDRHAEAVCDILRHAATSVPFWREAFDSAGLTVEQIGETGARDVLDRLPVTNKAVYRMGYPNRVTSQGDRDSWRFLASSGTVDRLTVVTDLRKRDHLAAVLIRVNKEIIGRDVGVMNVEIPPQCCNVRCALPDEKDGIADFVSHLWKTVRRGKLKTPETVAKLRGCLRQIVLPRKVLLPIDPLPKAQLQELLDERLRQIAQARPAIIRALPVYLVWLADRMRERGTRFPSLQAVLPWGGLVTPAMARRIEGAFGVPFIDVYGATELGEIAIASCPERTLHVLEDLYEVEILDDSGDPVPDGEIGHITVTDTTNRAMPMIRYQVGDVGYFVPGTCACGRTSRRLVVCGRSAETLHVSESGRTVTAYDFLELFFADPNIMNFRVDELGRNRFSATIVEKTKDGTDRDRLAGSLQELLGCSSPPALKVAEFIRPADSGKYRFAYPRKKTVPAQEGAHA